MLHRYFHMTNVKQQTFYTRVYIKVESRILASSRTNQKFKCASDFSRALLFSCSCRQRFVALETNKRGSSVRLISKEGAESQGPGWHAHIEIKYEIRRVKFEHVEEAGRVVTEIHDSCITHSHVFSLHTLLYKICTYMSAGDSWMSRNLRNTPV